MSTLLLKHCEQEQYNQNQIKNKYYVTVTDSTTKVRPFRPYRIQRRSTKIIPELRDLSYEEYLKECGLTTLETRLRGVQIKVFKILNGYENIDRNMFFSLKKDNRTRGRGKISKGLL